MHTGVESQFIQDLEEVVSGMSNNAACRRVSTPWPPLLSQGWGKKDKPNQTKPPPLPYLTFETRRRKYASVRGGGIVENTELVY